MPSSLLPGALPAFLALAAPLLLLAVGLVRTGWANERPQVMARLSGAVAWLAFFSAILAAAAHIAGGAVVRTFYSVELPGNIGAFALSTYVNSLTAIMLVLVSFVGIIVTRYAYNYLDGDENRGRFHKWLALTLASILTLIISGNLLMFALAWMATSLCLNQLLMFYHRRPAAVLVAHKKFIASRISELSLLTAIVLIGSTLHTLQFDEMFKIMSASNDPLPTSLEIAALLIAFSAGLKSAQFPFHGWLLQVMEAPTPVSALLHAGIVNAGAFLVIRMSPIMSHSELALTTLAVVGLITLALASMVMLTQTSIKVSLAWSTTAQMGFMLLECGLGLYSLAMLHLVAHSLYKAHAFLASGSGVEAFRAPTIPYPAKGLQFGRLILALITGVLTTLAVGYGFGITLSLEPALLAAGAVIAVAVSQLLLQTATILGARAFLLRGIGMSLLVSVAYFTLHHAFEYMLDDSILPVQQTAGTVEYALAAAVVLVFLVLLVLQQMLKQNPASLGEGLYMHLYNGLYIDVYITRMSQKIWPSPTPDPEVSPAPFSPVKSTRG